MQSTENLPRMPFGRDGILDISPTLRRLQEEGPITRVRTHAGDVAWLITRYEEARALFNDARLGRSHPGEGQAARISDAAVLGGPMGNHETEKTDHGGMRRLLAPAFSPRRMRALRERIDLLAGELLGKLASLTPPADLHEHLSVPLPVLVICELLGVPDSDRTRFRALADQVGLMNAGAQAAEAFGELTAYMGRLVEHKRAEPGEDVISDLTAAYDRAPSGATIAGLSAARSALGGESSGSADLAEVGIARLAAGLLFAGFETTVTRIDVGTLLLLTHRDQRAALIRDPALVPGAVEEILRVAAPGDGALPRYAHADIEVAGVLIRRGEAVLLSTAIANRDRRAFDVPDKFDITRDASSHLAFGYGSRFCIGAHLARAELQSVFGALFRRFPSLELAVPLPQVRLRSDVLTGGVEELPVTW